MSDATAKKPAASMAAPPRKRVGCLLKAIYIIMGFLALLVLFFTWRIGRLNAEAEKILREAERTAAALQPEPISIEDNAAPLYQEAYSLLASPKLHAYSGLSWRLDSAELEIGADEVKEFLKADRAALDKLAEAAAKPGYDLGVDYLLPYKREFPSLMTSRAAVHLLTIAARRAAHDGDFDTAVERIGQALNLCNHVSQPRMLLDHLVGEACKEVPLLGLRDILNEFEPDATFLEKIITDLGFHLENRVPLHEILRSARTAMILACARVMCGGSPDDLGFGTLSAKQKWRIYFSRASGKMLADARTADEHWERVTRITAKPYPQALDEAIDLQDDPVSAARLENLGFPYSVTRLSLVIVFRNNANSLGLLRAARLGVGCRLYKAKFGEYPEKLTDLTEKLPEHFTEIPTDPFSDKPMLYKRTETGCIVYSVGAEDRRDNGASNRLPDIYEPDLVFILDPAKFKAYREKLRQRRQNPRGRRQSGQPPSRQSGRVTAD